MAVFDSLDYRRFDHMRESDEEPQDQQFSPDLVRRFQQTYSASNPVNKSWGNAERRNGKFYPASNIKIHPNDDSVPA